MTNIVREIEGVIHQDDLDAEAKVAAIADMLAHAELRTDEDLLQHALRSTPNWRVIRRARNTADDRLHELLPPTLAGMLATYSDTMLDEAARFGHEYGLTPMLTMKDVHDLYEFYREDIWDIVWTKGREAGYTGTWTDEDGEEVTFVRVIEFLAREYHAKARGAWYVNTPMGYEKSMVAIAVNATVAELLAAREAEAEAARCRDN